MTRETSVDVYNQIKDEGLLGNLQMSVYTALRGKEPMTQGECAAWLFPSFQRHDIAPRFAELKRFGVLKECGKRPCRVTGRVCYVWQLTESVAMKPSKGPTKNQLISELKKRVALLEDELSKCLNKRPGELF